MQRIWILQFSRNKSRTEYNNEQTKEGSFVSFQSWKEKRFLPHFFTKRTKRHWLSYYDYLPSLHLRPRWRYCSAISGDEGFQNIGAQLSDKVRWNRYYHARWWLDSVCRSPISQRWIPWSPARYIWRYETMSTQTYCFYVCPQTQNRSWYDTDRFYWYYAKNWVRAQGMVCTRSGDLDTHIFKCAGLTRSRRFFSIQSFYFLRAHVSLSCICSRRSWVFCWTFSVSRLLVTILHPVSHES